MDFLPLDLENIITDYKNQCERVDEINNNYEDFIWNFEEYTDDIIAPLVLKNITIEAGKVIAEISKFVSTIGEFIKDKNLEGDFDFKIDGDLNLKVSLDYSNYMGVIIRFHTQRKITTSEKLTKEIQNILYADGMFEESNTLQVVFDGDTDSDEVYFFGYIGYECDNNETNIDDYIEFDASF